MKSFPFVAALGLFVAGAAAQAAGPSQEHALDPASQKALAETQALLLDPAQRAKIGKESNEAESVQRQVRAMAGSDQDAEAIYGLASEVFADMARKSGGDPLKMMEMIEGAKANPAAFGADFTPAQREKLKELSRRMPASGQPSMPSKP